MNKFLLFLIFPTFVFGQFSGSASVSIDQLTSYCNLGECNMVNATYTETKATDSYTVSSMPYFQFPITGGIVLPATNSPGTNNDDFWSTTIPIPFTFCFYGNSYSSLIIGTNGLISFSQDVTNSQCPDCFCPWNITQSIPSTTIPVNSIFGVFQDIHYANIPVTSSINYYAIGTSPNRVFVVNFFEIPQYPSQNSNLQTSQIVLHETTNIIDVNVQRRVPLNTWNSGRGIIGIQNINGTSASFPPNRNTGNWSATNESWRFSPNGAITSQISWKKNGVTIGSTNPILICNSTSNDVIEATVAYTNCDGTTTMISDTAPIEVIATPNFSIPVNLVECSSIQSPALFDLSANTNLVLSALNFNDYEVTFYTNASDAENGGGSSQIINVNTYSSIPYPQTVFIRIENLITGCSYIRQFSLNVNPIPSQPTGSFLQYFLLGQTLQNLVINGNNIQWYAENIGGNPLPITTLLINGTTYYCTQSNEFGCESGRITQSTRFPVTVQQTLSNTNFLFSELSISPNPTKSFVKLSNNKPIEKIEIFNALGQKVTSDIINTKEYILDLLNYNSGVYFIKLYVDKIEKTIKIIKN